jgi:hypothetical protein
MSTDNHQLVHAYIELHMARTGWLLPLWCPGSAAHLQRERLLLVLEQVKADLVGQQHVVL